MIRQGDKHLCEWRYGMSSHFYSVLFVAMVAASETEINQIGLGFPEEVDAYKRYQQQRGFFQQIEAEWKASWPSLYKFLPGAPMGYARPDAPAKPRRAFFRFSRRRK
jgi:hypothetical protein